MNNTTAEDILEFFETSFKDYEEIPEEVELIWLRKAVSRYSVELDPLNYDKDLEEFDCVLDDEVISILAHFIKQLYQEREVSKVNKRVSIVGKDISIDGNGNGKTAARTELEYDASKSKWMVNNLKPTSYN